MSRRTRPRHCPGCGAPAGDASGTGAVPCDYCGLPLVPLGVPDPRTSLRCAGCAALVAEGASFCPHCGAALAAPAPRQTVGDCPACGAGTTMAAFRLAPTRGRPEGHGVHGCRRCGGCFVPRATLDALLAEAAAAVVPGGVDPKQVPRFELRVADRKVTYRRCPSCGELMARRNFARISGIVVDVCDGCGTFFDARELEDVLAFVRAGGLLLAARREAAEPKAPAVPVSSVATGAGAGLWDVDPPAAELFAGLSLLGGLVRFSTRWLADRFGD